MSRSIIAKYVTPWKYRREQQLQQRITELRARDGDNCRRCRRQIRFDLQNGHDRGPKLESIAPYADSAEQPLDNLCLCHGRCNGDAGDDTIEVTERVRRKSEAALFATSRKRARA
jgi:hypothetical protein